MALAASAILPPAGLEAQGVLKDAPKIRYEYNPHLPPVLRSAPPTAPSAEKRQKSAALPDASRGPGASESAPAFGVRQPSGAFPGDAATTDQLLELLATARQRPLSEPEAKLLADALRRREPWLE